MDPPGGSSSLDPALALTAARGFLAAMHAAESDRPEWEEPGMLLWDLTAMPDHAAALSKAGGAAMLVECCGVVIARSRWRAAELALGALANLASQPGLQLPEGLASLALERALWVDDAAALGEAARLVASVLASGKAGSGGWWELLLRPETQGRLVWIVESTTSSELLARGCAGCPVQVL